MKYFAGIGNRNISFDVAENLKEIAQYLHMLGYTLRSGGAIGADFAFESGSVNSIVFKKATPDAVKLASRFHPNWSACNDHAKNLHGRNAHIILGQNLDDPVKFVLAYTVDEERGGTALGMRIARSYKIPTYNLYKINFDQIKSEIGC